MSLFWVMGRPCCDRWMYSTVCIVWNVARHLKDASSIALFLYRIVSHRIVSYRIVSFVIVGMDGAILGMEAKRWREPFWLCTLSKSKTALTCSMVYIVSGVWSQGIARWVYVCQVCSEMRHGMKWTVFVGSTCWAGEKSIQSDGLWKKKRKRDNKNMKTRVPFSRSPSARLNMFHE